MNIIILEYPFFTAIWDNGEHICGGSIITKDMILTAAHCVANVANPGRLEAFFGISTKEEIMNKKAEGHDIHSSKIKTIILNPNAGFQFDFYSSTGSASLSCSDWRSD